MIRFTHQFQILAFCTIVCPNFTSEQLINALWDCVSHIVKMFLYTKVRHFTSIVVIFIIHVRFIIENRVIEPIPILLFMIGQNDSRNIRILLQKSLHWRRWNSSVWWFNCCWKMAVRYQKFGEIVVLKTRKHGNQSVEFKWFTLNILPFGPPCNDVHIRIHLFYPVGSTRQATKCRLLWWLVSKQVLHFLYLLGNCLVPCRISFFENRYNQKFLHWKWQKARLCLKTTKQQVRAIEIEQFRP